MENIVRKEKIACNKQFLLFSQCFLPYMKLIFHFECTLSCRLHFFTLDQFKILSSGNGYSLPNNKILLLSKFKAFADDKIILTQELNFVLGRVENIVGKGENAGYQHFLLFPCFQKLSFPEVLKVGTVW